MSRSKAEKILREFYTDVKLAHGTGKGGYGDKIDEESLNWPDLATTYKKASAYFKKYAESQK